tara:strand:+ start:407 stop:1330 length:924 start_codon:yes stop_codon:yes gene_type:complete
MVGKRVAIVLVNYNGFSDTAACLNSLMQLTSDVQLSLILVDNASKDASKLEGLKDECQNLHIIYNQQNVGFGRANNIGIQWAQQHLKFDYICLLNNDTIVEPDFLDYLVEPFVKDPQIGVTTGKIYYEYDRNIIWYGGADINLKRGWPKIADYNGVATANGANRPRYVSFVSGCLMMFSKESISTLKGFDEQFFMYCEDLELCLRTSGSGMKMYYEPRSIIYHKVQGSSSANEVGMKASNPRLAFIYSNMKSNQYLALKKNTTGINMLTFAFLFHAELLLLTFKLVLKGRMDILPIYFKILGTTFKG